MTTRLVRALIALGLICGWALVVVAGASAANLVYVKGGDIWVASPDGSVQRQITTNGASAGYISPTETDAGVIVAPRHGDHFFYRFGLDGSSAGGPWTSGDFSCGSLSSSPFAAQVSPGGGLIVYDYMNSNFCTGGDIQRRVAFANSDVYTAAGSYPIVSWGMYPRWIPGQSVIAAVNQNGTEINTQNAPWLVSCTPQPCSPYFTRFDISRTGWRVLAAETVTADPASGQADLELWDNNGPPPESSAGVAVCKLVNWADWNSAPRWSPDGTQFTWATSAGVYVSPAPVSDGAGHNCVLDAKLVAPGGSMPDWGAQSLPASALTPAPTPDGTTTEPSVTTPATPPPPAAVVVSNLAQSHRAWRAGNRMAVFAAKRRMPIGTLFSFALSEKAGVRFAFAQRLRGRNAGGRCVAPTRANRRGRACTRTVGRGALSFEGSAGRNSVGFQGRLSRVKKLKPGRYRLTIVATNAAGLISSPGTLNFTIVK